VTIDWHWILVNVPRRDFVDYVFAKS